MIHYRKLFFVPAMDPGVCKYCGRVCSSPSTLRQHEQRHKKSGPYSCCDKIFFSKANLRRHECHVHEKTISFLCTQCGASFAVNCDLNRHMRRHTKNLKYSCDICQAKFETRASLKDHISMHEDDYKHTYSECGKKFRYKTNLSRHVRTHHKQRD